jgi:hypothetical protein
MKPLLCSRKKKEEAEQDAKMQESSPQGVEFTASNASMQTKSPLEEEAREASSEEHQVGPDGRYLFDLPGR